MRCCMRGGERKRTSLSALGADNVRADVDALLNVLRVSNHVHIQDAILVQSVDNGLGWDTDGGDEELGATIDDDANELVELALCVVVAARVSGRSLNRDAEGRSVLGLAGAAADLWDEEIDAEWCILVIKVAFQLCDLLAEHVWSVADAANDTEATCICDAVVSVSSTPYFGCGGRTLLRASDQLQRSCQLGGQGA